MNEVFKPILPPHRASSYMPIALYKLEGDQIYIAQVI